MEHSKNLTVTHQIKFLVKIQGGGALNESDLFLKYDICLVGEKCRYTRGAALFCTTLYLPKMYLATILAPDTQKMGR